MPERKRRNGRPARQESRREDWLQSAFNSFGGCERERVEAPDSTRLRSQPPKDLKADCNRHYLCDYCLAERQLHRFLSVTPLTRPSPASKDE